MKFFSSLSEKAWIPHDTASVVAEEKTQPAGRTALNFFISVVSVIFFLFTITFLSRSQYPDFQALAGEPWQPFTNPVQLWINSGILLFSSVAIQMAYVWGKRDRLSLALVAIFTASLFALLFLVGQLLVWQQLVEQGYYLASNPANSYFFLFTAVHGLHLFGGLVALAIVLVQFLRKNSLLELVVSLSLCKRYWHFLFFMWLLLFGLLTSSPETYKIIAELCGF